MNYTEQALLNNFITFPNWLDFCDNCSYSFSFFSALYGSLLAVVFLLAAINFYKPISYSDKNKMEMSNNKQENSVEESGVYTDDDTQSDLSSVTRF